MPATGRHALTVWSEALGIEWPTSHRLVTAAVTVEHNEDVKQAPAMSLVTVRKLEELSPNKEVCMCKRAFGAAILVMTYARLRFADAQKIRTFDCNDDSVHGALTRFFKD